MISFCNSLNDKSQLWDNVIMFSVYILVLVYTHSKLQTIYTWHAILFSINAIKLKTCNGETERKAWNNVDIKPITNYSLLEHTYNFSPFKLHHFIIIRALYGYIRLDFYTFFRLLNEKIYLFSNRIVFNLFKFITYYKSYINFNNINISCLFITWHLH